jgi:tetratricopeptide (TPR) repeat protein
MVIRSASQDHTGKAAYRYEGAALHKHWARLHQGDREPWPDEPAITRNARQHAVFGTQVAAAGGSRSYAAGLQDAWRKFHAGNFAAAIADGTALGALGAVVANKAAAVDSLYSKQKEAVLLQELDAAVKRGDAAVKLLPDHANAHYTLALALGRYSQRITILRALAEGLAGRVRTHLERALILEPHHAEAQVALGLYHAEIIHKLGALAAGLTYGASREQAIGHFKSALEAAPDSPIIHLEYANGLSLLDAAGHQKQIRHLYEQAAACEPVDAMESLDAERARRGAP